MSSIYDQAIGINEKANEVLSLINMNKGNVARFRDAFIDDQGRASLYCRIGGDNRDIYATPSSAIIHGIEIPNVSYWGNDLRNNPYYISGSEEDDSFDSSYCTFYFAIPIGKETEVSKIPISEKPNDKWFKLVEDVKKGDVILSPDLLEKLEPQLEIKKDV